MGDLATRTLVDAVAAVKFTRDQHATLCTTLSGPRWACKTVAAEVALRTDLIVAAIPKATRRNAVGHDVIGPVQISAVPVTARHGACMCCADPMPDYLGGQCILCELALAKALQRIGRLK